jgi:transcriptional regulator with PAS, ATPase and Fis domain
LDDRTTLFPNRTEPEVKTTDSSSPEGAVRIKREQSPRDWFFESNCKSQKIAPLNRLVGESTAIAELRARISRYAKTEATVLISGETGTGKELIARILHDLSPRKDSPFVAINCAAIPGPLAESELFGSTKGAFTGAVHCRKGLLSRANNGTLFLDEFGELLPEVQSKLLRVLEFGAFCRVGGNLEERTDVRIVAATNRDLERSVLQGEFRADLFYRINVLPIAAPPLRDRRGDIPHLAGKILGDFLPDGSRLRITESVMTQLLQLPWPGNVRELKNVLHRSLVMSNGKVIDRLECDLANIKRNHANLTKSPDPVQRLINSLTQNKGRIEAVANEFNVSVRTIQRRMKESGLRLSDYRNL